jgi:hypothetical protein
MLNTVRLPCDTVNKNVSLHIHKNVHVAYICIFTLFTDRCFIRSKWHGLYLLILQSSGLNMQTVGCNGLHVYTASLRRKSMSTSIDMSLLSNISGSSCFSWYEFPKHRNVYNFFLFLPLYINILQLFRRNTLFCMTEALKPQCVTNF